MDKSRRRRRSTDEQRFGSGSDATPDFPHPDDVPKGSEGWNPPQSLTWFLLLLLVLLVLTLAYLKDENQPWDDDLVKPIATEQVDISAPIRLKLLLKTAVTSEEPLPPTSAWEWDTAFLEQFIEEHSSALDNFRDLLEEKEQGWQPENSLWKMEDLGGDSGWASLLLVKQAEAAYLAKLGREEEAFRAAIDMAVFASLLERIDAWPSFMGRALELHQRCAQSLAILLSNTQLSETSLATLQNVEYKPWQLSLANISKAMSGYYAFERKLLRGPMPGEPAVPLSVIPARSGWVFFKPNATLRLFADSFRELKDASRSTPFPRTNQVTSRLQRHMAGPLGLGNPNWSGEGYFVSRIHPYAALSDQVSLARTSYAAVMYLFAVRRCVIGEMRLPQTLEELVPKYLSEPLMDPFSGDPMRYDAVRGLIYSVGADLRDEGGVPTFIPLSNIDEPTVVTGIGVAKVGS